MPTGYTSDIYEGKDQTFEEFVWKCARAFGANVMMRDEPMSARIEGYIPSSWCLGQLAKAKERLRELERMSPEIAEAMAREAYDEGLREWEASCTKKNEMRARYENMLVQVKAWLPPTPDHQGLKDFMIEQITISMDGDCKIYEDCKPKLLDSEAWYKNEISKAKRGIEYHTAEHEKELNRTRQRNEWNEALRRSVPQP